MYGGLNQNSDLKDYYVFNTATNNWTTNDTKGARPSIRERSTICLVKNSSLVLFGGYHASDDLEEEVHYNDLYALNLKNLIWSELKPEADLPEERFAHTSTAFNSKMYIFGGMQKLGEDQIKNFNEIWKINLEPDDNQELIWEKIDADGEPPEERHAHCACALRNSLVIFGGRGALNKIFNDTHIFDTKKSVWQQVIIRGEPPKARFYHAMELNAHNEIMLFGGNVSFSFLNLGNTNLYILKPDNIHIGSKNAVRDNDNIKRSSDSYKEDKASSDNDAQDEEMKDEYYV